MIYDKSQIVFCDTETTGLYANMGHEVWEIAVIDWNSTFERWQEQTWTLRPDLTYADPMSLRINKFYQRTIGREGFDHPSAVAAQLAETFDGKHIVGAIPSFDAIFIEKLMREQNYCPSWHYHIIDVEAMTLGYLARRCQEEKPEFEVPIPWKSEWMFEHLGVPKPDPSTHHSAMADCRKVKEVWEKIMDVSYKTIVDTTTPHQPDQPDPL